MSLFDPDEVLSCCEEAFDSVLTQVPDCELRLQRAVCVYIEIFTNAAKGHPIDTEILRDAAEQTVMLTEEFSELADYCPTTWKGLVALKNAANQFLYFQP